MRNRFLQRNTEKAPPCAWLHNHQNALNYSIAELSIAQIYWWRAENLTAKDPTQQCQIAQISLWIILYIKSKRTLFDNKPADCHIQFLSQPFVDFKLTKNFIVKTKIKKTGSPNQLHNTNRIN